MSVRDTCCSYTKTHKSKTFTDNTKLYSILEDGLEEATDELIKNSISSQLIPQDYLTTQTSFQLSKSFVINQSEPNNSYFLFHHFLNPNSTFLIRNPLSFRLLMLLRLML